MRSKQSGSILVLVLGVIAISVFLLSALVQLVVVAKDQIAISKDMVRYRSVLDSLLDYSIHGLRQRWCFSATMLQDPCNFNHPYSSERLLYSDNTVRSLAEVKANNPAFPAASPYRLTNFSITVPIASITAAHPLFRAVTPAQSAVFNSVTFNFVRVTNVKIPVRGDEVLVRIQVTLNSSVPLFRGLTDLRATSTLLTFPRQLNQFSAVVPRDLRMDLASSNSAAGDMNLYRFPSRVAGGTGITFESPVFVNRDVYVNAHSNAANPPYSAATFGQRLIIGTGRIYQGGALMAPQTPGGEETRYYDAVSSMGGFLRGVEVEGEEDAGLRVFAGLAAVAPPNDAAMNQCRSYLANKNNLERTRRSALFARRDPASTPSDYQFELRLSANNMFYEQLQNAFVFASVATTPGDPLTGGWNTRPAISNPADKAVGYIYVTFGNPAQHWIQGRLAYNSIVSSTFADRNGVAPFAPPEFNIELVPIVRGGSPQPNQAKLRFSLVAGQDWTAIPTPIRVYFKAFDLGHHAGGDRRRNAGGVNTFEPSRLREANFQLAASAAGLAEEPLTGPLSDQESHTQFYLGAATCAGTFPKPVHSTTDFVKASACSGPGVAEAPVDDVNSDGPAGNAFNYANVETNCTAPQSGRGTAIGMADWGTSFLNNTRRSWHFEPMVDGSAALAYPLPVNATYPELLFSAATDNAFVVRSIVSRCRIDATATVVNALLSCDQLVIDNRAAPLTINGTIIAGRTDINSAAIRAGIRWRSLRHPQSLYEMRNNLVLTQRDTVTACGTSLGLPEFSAVGSISTMATQYLCNPLSIIQHVDPFTWTTVDPDCGLAAGSRFYRCMRRPLRYMIREISRVGSI